MAEDQYAMGFAPDEEAPVVDVRAALNEEDGITFSAEVTIEARALADVPKATICFELFARSSETRRSLARMSYDQWSMRDFIGFCSFAQSLGSNRVVDAPWGKIDPTLLPRVQEARTDVLKACLVSEKKVAVSLWTDFTLARDLTVTKGVKTYPCKEGVRLDVPGCPEYVIVATSGPRKGRVVSGAQAFVKWYNETHSSYYDYLEVDEVARVIAFFVVSNWVTTIKDSGIDMVEVQASRKPHPLRHLLGKLPANIQKFVQPLRKLVMQAYQARHLYPTIPFKDRVYHIEVVLHRYFDAMSGAALNNMRMLANDIETHYEAMWAKAKSTYKDVLTDDQSAPKGDRLARLVRGGVVCGESVFNTQGSVMLFVADSRNHIRDDCDVARKSDCNASAGALGAPGSVCAKICTAIDALDDIVADGVAKYDADAFGTGSENWWHHELLRAKSVKYYDMDAKKVPPQGAPFYQRNVEHLEPGCGKGRILFDDTFNAPEGKQQQVSMTNKVTSVIKADYEGGFVKLYYGSGIDASLGLHQIPSVIAALREKYSAVILTPGGTLHTPEYFAVFGNRYKRGLWVPPPNIGKFSLRGTEATEPVDETLFHKYVRGWLVNKVSDIIRSNIAINTQVIAGFMSCPILDTALPLSDKSVSLGGVKTHASIGVVNLAPGKGLVEKEEEKDYDM